MKKVLGYGSIFLGGVLVQTLTCKIPSHDHFKLNGLVAASLVIIIAGVLYYTGCKSKKVNTK